MADFCNRCADKMGFEADFDIHKIFKELEADYYKPVLCEGCAMAAVANMEGELKLIDVDQLDGWQSEEDFFKTRGDI